MTDDDDCTPLERADKAYYYYRNMPTELLEELAKEAIDSLEAAQNRAQAEVAAVKLRPFFLDCTFPRVAPATQKKLREVLDCVEDRHGSLASALGIDEADLGDDDEVTDQTPTPDDPPSSHEALE